MWLHIRGVGQWTNRLFEYFEKEQEKLHNGEIAAHPCTQKKRLSNGSIQNNNQNPIKKLQATITRTFSNRDPNKKPGVQLVGFNNQSFQGDATAKNSVSESDLNNPAACSSNTGKKISIYIISVRLRASTRRKLKIAKNPPIYLRIYEIA